MAEELITTPTPETVTTQSNVAPGLDNELDAALAKSFKNVGIQKEVKNEVQKTPVEEPKKEPVKEITIDLKKPSQEIKEPQKESKPIEEEKPLPNPDTLDSSPEKKGQAAWNALKNNYKRSFQTIEQKDQEITKLKATLAEKSGATEKEVQALKTQIEELSRYRAMVDIQADPEFVSKFDQPIEKAMGSIKEMLLGMNVAQETIDQIDFTNTKLMDMIVDNVGQHRDKFVARKLQSKIDELLSLSDKRDETLLEQRKNYKELLETKKKESFSKGAEAEGKMIKHLENLAVGKDRDGNQKGQPIVFLNKREVKDGLSQPEIDQINSHNALVDEMRNDIKDAMKLEAPEDRMDLIVAAIASKWLVSENNVLKKKISSLEENLKKISTVNSETEKVKTPAVHRNGNGQPIDTDQALNSFFKRR